MYDAETGYHCLQAAVAVIQLSYAVCSPELSAGISVMWSPGLLTHHIETLI